MSAIEPKTTGWPPSTLMQDYSRQLSRWLSNNPGARRHADEPATDGASAEFCSGNLYGLVAARAEILGVELSGDAEDIAKEISGIREGVKP